MLNMIRWGTILTLAAALGQASFAGPKCPPTPLDLMSGAAVAAGDLDGDGQVDHTYPNNLANWDLCCLSSGGPNLPGPVVYVKRTVGAVKYYVHCCAYELGKNKISPDMEDGSYNGTTTDKGADDDGDGKEDSVEYDWCPDDETLHVYVYEDGELVAYDFVVDPTSPGDIPNPNTIPRTE